MPRLRQVSRDEAEAPIVTVMYDFMFGDRDPVAEPGTSTGSPGDWWTVFALVPDVLEHAVAGFGLYRSPKRILDPVLRELGQTRAGWATGSQFVFSQHCKSLRGLGVSEEKIAAVPAWAAATCFDRSSSWSSPTPTAWCWTEAACPTPCSRPCRSSCPTRRSSS
ncbi:MAG: carboxymuconolactone decarboxylase family protein [Acidimicrobiales bacterium]